MRAFSLFERFLYWIQNWFKPKVLPPWEPQAESDFRKRVGFIDRRPPGAPRTEFGDEMVRAQREALWDRVFVTTHDVPPDRRIKLQPHGNAMEYRARWDGRAWEPPPPVIDRAESWGFGVRPEADFELRRIQAGMRDG